MTHPCTPFVLWALALCTLPLALIGGGSITAAAISLAVWLGWCTFMPMISPKPRLRFLRARTIESALALPMVWILPLIAPSAPPTFELFFLMGGIGTFLPCVGSTLFMRHTAIGAALRAPFWAPGADHTQWLATELGLLGARLRIPDLKVRVVLGDGGHRAILHVENDPFPDAAFAHIHALEQRLNARATTTQWPEGWDRIIVSNEPTDTTLFVVRHQNPTLSLIRPIAPSTHALLHAMAQYPQ